MNKFVFSFLLCAFICCETFSQLEINIQNLKESFLAKDDKQYLKQFPINFEQLNSYFGWDSDNNKPQELYDESYAYIDYWFKILNSEKYKVYEKNIIKICANGHWEADAIGYFQMKSRSYIKEKQKYYLLNDLKDNVAKSVLFFLFDSPHPKFDADFASNLNTTKRKVLEEVFENDMYDHDNVADATEVSETIGFSYYRNNDSYFVNDIDINNDGVLDKVVSHKKYQGEELLLFISENNTYKLALKTINFSEDGGNQVVEIKKHKNGFVIVTSFLDKGFFESHYFIAYKNERWILTNTIYKTKSSNEENSFIYVCDVKQDIDIGSSNWDNLKFMPDESVRDKICTKEYIDENNVSKVIRQLKLAETKVKTDLVVFKVMPNNPDETIMVIPEIVDEGEHYFELNSYILIIDSKTGRIKNKYFESSQTNGWTSDALQLREIKIDTAPYMVADNTRAFGIRVYYYGSSRANPYNNETLSLFAKERNSLKKILNNYEVMYYGGEWDTNCVGEFQEQKKVLILTKNKTNMHCDIVVKTKVTETKNFEDTNGDCDSKEEISRLEALLKFDGEEYEEIQKN